jgi:hypothetical protein
MRLKDLWHSWDKFWFTPQSTLPVCVFRIMIGLLILEAHLLMAPDWLNWYTDKGVYSLSTCQQYLGAACIDLLIFFPQTDVTVYTFMAIFLISTVCFTLGLFTRWSTLLTFIMLTTLNHRNPIILNGGDTVLRCCMFWMLFAPSGELLSLDRWIKTRWGGEQLEADPKRSMWSWRLLQLQVCAVYCQCFWSKTLGASWLDGTALYYVLHEREYLRFPLPFNIENIWISRCMTWGTLVVEFAIWSLIWVKEFRYYVLAAALCLHIGIEYSMNIPVFEQIMIASLILFVEPSDIRWFGGWVRDKLSFASNTSQTTVAH